MYMISRLSVSFRFVDVFSGCSLNRFIEKISFFSFLISHAIFDAG
jgi:hypothetical protein